ncbi:hypothetical protein [Serratia marcescens]|uniref:hypothetical protein n=1 Tax=Serratia marcescens TaxID=615 RepID=UPI00313B1FF1
MTVTTESLRGFLMEVNDEIGSAHPDTRDTKISARLLRDILTELLANREAQPVLYASEETLAYAKEGEKSLVTWSEPMGDAVIPLFTALPAPANANSVAWEMRYWNSGHNMWHDWERITAEQHREMSVQHAADNDYEFRVLYDAPPAPAVPDGYCVMPLTLTAENGAKCALAGEFKVSRTVRCHECGGEGCDDCADAGEFEEEITVPWDTIKDIYRAAVDACRAAMLAQPVSQGYKLVPAEPTEDMIAAAMNCDDVTFNADETFCVNFGNIYAAMVAAAPEGGNDHDTRR